MKRFRHVRARTRRRIQADRHDDRLVAGHPVATLIRQVPLEPEVPLATRRSVRRDDGNEERAVADLATDLLVPHITAPQPALVEPDFDALSPKRIADPTRGIGVLRSVAEEYRPGRGGDLVWRLCPHFWPSSVVCRHENAPRHWLQATRPCEGPLFTVSAAVYLGRSSDGLRSTRDPLPTPLGFSCRNREGNPAAGGRPGVATH